MKKIEWVYREILYQAMEKKNRTLTQLELSEKLGISLSLVHHALQPLVKMNAVDIKRRSFSVIDIKKILFHWASVRNVEKDIMFQTRVELPVRKIEAEMPDDVIYGAYSAYKFKFKDVPADYSDVYVYGEVKRFPKNGKTPNLFVLQKDAHADRYGKTTTIAQTFVDLWNMKSWYAKEFVTALQHKIGD